MSKKRDDFLSFPVSKSEKQKIKNEAKRLDVPVAQLIRHALRTELGGDL